MACRNNKWYSKRDMGESIERGACQKELPFPDL